MDRLHFLFTSCICICLLLSFPHMVFSAIDLALLTIVTTINDKGPSLGVVVPNSFEINSLFVTGVFSSDLDFPHIDISGRRFYVGEIESSRVIVVMTGLAMLNAGITTQLLLTYFNITGVLHYGVAGNANDQLHIGDITIPRFWAHAGLWNWQRYGEGVQDQLALEENGDFTREIGHLSMGNYNDPPGNRSNYLNNVWYQAEEVFPITGTPEVRQHFFWVPVYETYYDIASQIVDEELDLAYCVNDTTCLSTKPRVVTVARGISASIFVANAAYRKFLHDTFDVSPVDMETAGVALTCLTNNVPFIAFRAVSGGSAIFLDLAATNAVIVLREFIKLMGTAEMVKSGSMNADPKQSFLYK